MMKNKHKIRRFCFSCLIVPILILGIAQMVYAQDPSSFYQGKTINWIVSSGPSSPTTLLSRIAAKYLGEELDARVRIENQSRNKGLNFAFTRAKRDGLTIVSKAKSAVVFNELAKAPGIRYKSVEFVYLTDLMPDLGALFVKKDSPYHTLNDLRSAKNLKAGGTTAKGFLAASASILYEVLGIKGTIIPGYKSPPKVILALAQGEVDLMAFQAAASLKSVKNGQIRALFVVSDHRFEGMPNVPTLKEFGVTVSPQWETALSLISNTGQAVMAPPGVPKERTDFLRAAFQKIARNPDLQKDIEKLTGHFSPFAKGETMQQAVSTIMSNQRLSDQLKTVVNKYSAATK